MPTVETVNLPADLRLALEGAVRALVEAVQPQLIILFGSYAEGRAHEDSDVDLLVVTETENRWETAADLREIVGPYLRRWPLDVLVYAPDRWEDTRRLPGLLPRDVDEYGVRLYEK